MKILSYRVVGARVRLSAGKSGPWFGLISWSLLRPLSQPRSQSRRLKPSREYGHPCSGSPAFPACKPSPYAAIWFHLRTEFLAEDVSNSYRFGSGFSEQKFQSGKACAISLRDSECNSSQRDHAMLMVIYHGGLGINEVCGLEWRLVRPRDEGRYQGTMVGNGGKTRGVIPPARVASFLYSRHGATQAIRMPYSAVARVAAWTPLKCIGGSRQRQSGRHFLNTSSWPGAAKAAPQQIRSSSAVLVPRAPSDHS